MNWTLTHFLRSASKAKLIPPFDHPSLRNIFLQIVTASQCRKGSLRYWLSAGPGDFLLSLAGCPSAAFYAIVIEYDYSPSSQGVTVISRLFLEITSIPCNVIQGIT